MLPTPAPVQASAPDLARRVGLILAALAALIIPLWSRLNRAGRRFERLTQYAMACRFPAGLSVATSPSQAPIPA